jgi:hypothetical protein
MREPVTRCLRIYTQDPATSRQDIAVAEAEVPYEPLAAGPSRCVMAVIDKDETPPRRNRTPRPAPPSPVDLYRLGVSYSAMHCSASPFIRAFAPVASDTISISKGMLSWLPSKCRSYSSWRPPNSVLIASHSSFINFTRCSAV